MQKKPSGVIKLGLRNHNLRPRGGSLLQLQIILPESKKSKANRLRAHKVQSLTIAESFKTARYDKRAEQIRDCGSILNFRACPDNHERFLTGANFCRAALCPMCMWRKGLLTAFQVCTVTETALERHPTLRFVFLTLTVPNVSGSELSDAIDHLIASHHRLFRRKQVKQAVKGTFRALEITYNTERDDYHPHLHVLLAVNSNYFTKNYITRDDWLKLWQEATRDDSITQVDIRVVKAKKGQKMAGVAGEVGKYVTKPSALCDMKLGDEKRAEVVTTLADAIHGRRLRGYWGMLKEIKRELKRAEVEQADDEELAKVTDKKQENRCTVCSQELMIEIYRWLSWEYTRVSLFKATPMERSVEEIMAALDKGGGNNGEARQ